MKKIVIEEPKFETIQTGVNEKVYFQTSDGEKFTNKKDAEHHEFYNIKVKMRDHGLPVEVKILDCKAANDLNRYIKDYGYNVDVFNFKTEDLTYPNTYVLREYTVHGDDFGKDDNWYDYTTYLDIYTLEEWKKHMIEQINKLN